MHVETFKQKSILLLYFLQNTLPFESVPKQNEGGGVKQFGTVFFLSTAPLLVDQ